MAEAAALNGSTPRKRSADHRAEEEARIQREANERVEDWGQLKRLGAYLAPRKARVALTIVLSILLSVIELVPYFLPGIIVDRYLASGELSGVWAMAGLLVAAVVLTFVLEATTNYLIALTGQETMRDLRLELYRKLQAQSLRFYDKNSVGWLVTRMTSDVNVLNELFAQGVVGIFRQLFMLVVILFVLLFVNWQLALWMMLTIPLMLLLSGFFRGRLRVSYRLTRLRLSRMNTHVQENITGMRTVQANTREPRQFEKFEDLNDAHRDAHYKTVFAYAMFFPLIEVVTVLGIGIVVWQGAVQFSKGTVTVGELLLFILLVERFFTPIRDLSEKFNLVQSAIAAGERLFKLLDMRPAIEDPEQPVEDIAFRHRIEFKDVWFAYDAQDAAEKGKEPNWVLKGVDFAIERGSRVAIVGPTGSGKSTLMSLLCRFYDIQKGEILVDGVDIRAMRQRDLRRKIAIVLQDVFLFRGSVSENIRLGETGISDARVEEVARAVNAHPFVEKLPQGYASNVMERGATLSVGQKQLLAFARALAFDPEILILDEATSNIDTETEKLIQEALDRVTEGRTSLVIAHRLSTIQNSDKILVLHHGHLAEEGSHAQLLARDGLYRRLYELQYREQASA